MTATISQRWLHTFRKMTKLSFLPNDIIWASPDDMSRRDIHLGFYWGDSILKTMKAGVITFLQANPKWKAILYTNTKIAAIPLKTSIDELMDSNEIDGDAIVIHGELEAHTKFYRAKLFTGAHDDNILNPRVLVATSRCANAGIDCPDVYWVVRQDMPPSILDLFQEMGRAGRRRNKIFGEDHYIVIFSLNSFNYLFIRSHLQTEDTVAPIILTKAERIQMLVEDLMDVLSLLVLDLGCKHAIIESHLGNAMCPSRLGPCWRACPTCLPESVYRHAFPAVKRSAIQTLLVREFSKVGRMILVPPPKAAEILDESFIEWFKKQSNLGKNVYGFESKRTPTGSEVECAILQLISTKMLNLTHSKSDNKEYNLVYVSLAFSGMVPTCTVEQSWEGIHLLDADEFDIDA
jgi:superfamily II DNA helicase RecQ